MLRDRPLRLAAVRHLRFGRNPAWPELPLQGDYFAERLGGAGAAGDPGRQRGGNRNDHAAMAARLLAALPGDPDLVVLAHALPDCDVSVSAGGALTRGATGRPLVFAVSEQGRVAPFTALRLAAAHHGDEFATVAVLVLDQGTLFYDDPALADLDTAADHAVGLLFTAAGRTRLGPPVQHTGVPPDRAAELVADWAAQAPSPAVLIAGPEVPPLPPSGARVRRAPGGHLCTPVWRELAAHLAGPGGRTVLLAEYEPALGYLSLAACDVPAAQVRASSPA